MNTIPFDARPLAPAFFVGVQEGFQHLPAIEIYNLTAQLGDVPAGSTVSRATLEDAGFYLPALRVREARRANWFRRNHAA